MESTVRRWLLSGCLVVSGVAMLAVAAVAVLTWTSVRGSDPRAPVLERPRGERPSGADADPGHGPSKEATDTPLRVLLELDSCEVYIEPAAPGEPLRVEAHYDAHDYKLEEIVDELDPDRYRLRFLVTSSRLITTIKQGIRGGQPQLRVQLPVDRPLDLELVQRNGGAIVDLSGLHLTDVTFDGGGALLKIDADEPLRGRLERFTVKGGQGALVVESLNLMQPRKVDIDFRMGQAHLDFRGPWAADTDVDLDLGLIDAIVRLPRDATITGIDTELAAPDSTELPTPVLHFEIETGRRTNIRVFE